MHISSIMPTLLSLSSHLPATKLLDTLSHYIENAEHIALFGHRNIDGDALGSLLGFGTLLEKRGKTCSYFTTVTPSRFLGFIPGIEKVQTTFDYGEYDLIFFLDFTPYSRIPEFTKDHEEYFRNKTVIVIDHHLDDTQRGNLEIKSTESSSNCGRLTEICHALYPTYIDENIATYRMLGLITDTGNFMWGESPARDLIVAQYLLEQGAKKEWLMQNLFFSSRPETLKMSKIIYDRVRTYGHVLYTRYTDEELAACGVDDDEMEGFLSPIKSIGNFPVFLRLKRSSTGRGGSLRSGYPSGLPRISVEKIAKTFPIGGGHAYAAGFSLLGGEDSSHEDDVQRIVNMVDSEAAKQISS